MLRELGIRAPGGRYSRQVSVSAFGCRSRERTDPGVTHGHDMEITVKYLVKARLKPSSKSALLEQVERGTLGRGSVAFGEYARNMAQARILDDGTICWLEVCFCPSPLNEEKQYWEQFFDVLSVENARDQAHCRDASGEQKRACFACTCTKELEREMLEWGRPFLDSLKD